MNMHRLSARRRVVAGRRLTVAAVVTVAVVGLGPAACSGTPSDPVCTNRRKVSSRVSCPSAAKAESARFLSIHR